MKCKRPLVIGSISKSKLLVFGMLYFLCFAARAENKDNAWAHAVDGVPDAYGNLNAQEVTVSGTVLDETGAPLPGSSILEKGTTNGVVADFDGNFSLTVSGANSVLVFSYMGYLTKEVAVGASTNISVQMELDAQVLDEIVVVGYGTQKKSEVTNAVVQTTGADIKKSPAVSLSNSLSGRMAGLYVSQTSSVPGFDDAQIMVRGFNTTRDNSALIVIDGVANADPDGLSRLDPNDIESISVLKDASAAIYGAQSAGGVILVTTKRGKTGKPTIDFSTTQAFEFPTTRVRSANALEYMNVLNSSRAIDGTAADFPVELIDKYRSGELQSEDWWNSLIDPPVYQSRHSLTMQGGSEYIRYFTSVGMAEQNGILRGDNKTSLQQYNVRSNVDVNISKSIEVGVDLSYRVKETETPQGGAGGEAGYIAQTSPLRPAYIDGDYRYPGEGWSHSNPAARLLSPGYRKYSAGVTSGTMRFKYKAPFLEGLSVDGFASIIKTLHHEKKFDYTWRYYEKDAAGQIVEKPSRIIEDIGLEEKYTESNRVTLNAKLNYRTIIADDHTIDAFVAYEQMDFKDNFLMAGRLGYDSPNIDYIFAGSPDRSNWKNDGKASESGRQNYFGRLNYDYSGKYLVGLTFRYDGSPIFPEETRWGFFPGVSAGWVISRENFMPENVFSNLKLRASWGELGNDRVDPFQYIGRYGYDSGWVVNGNEIRGIKSSSTPNPNITWEVTETTDIGLEVGLLNNRLSFEADVYRSNTRNILGQRQASIPNYTGLALPDENIGRMRSQGVEFQVGYKQSIGEVVLNLHGNYSYNENKIIYFDEVPQSEPYQKLEGMPFGSRLVYEAIGIYRTQADLDNNVNYNNAGLGGLIFKDRNGDGIIDGNDRYRYDTQIREDKDGNLFPIALPKSQFGLNIGLNYKDFDFSMLFQGTEGSKWKLDTGFDAGANGNGLAYVANNSYSLDNRDAELPRVRPTGIAASDSDFYYHNLFFIRMKSLEFGYTLPKDTMSKVGISNMRFYVSGQNLFMVYNNLAKYGAGDPEFFQGKGAGYPNMRSLGLGLNLSF